jgi:hypothetical protein
MLHAPGRRSQPTDDEDTPVKGIKELRKQLRPLGITVGVTQFDEYRLNFKKGSEATSYYTDDFDDALATGKAMAAEGLKS